MSSHIGPVFVTKGGCIECHNDMAVTVIPMRVLGQGLDDLWQMETPVNDIGPNSERNDEQLRLVHIVRSHGMTFQSFQNSMLQEGLGTKPRLEATPTSIVHQIVRNVGLRNTWIRVNVVGYRQAFQLLLEGVERREFSLVGRIHDGVERCRCLLLLLCCLVMEK